jgi:PKD repeat protein
MTLLRERAVAAVRCLCAGLASGAVAAAQSGFDGQGFRLAPEPAASSSEATFLHGETLYVQVWSDRIDPTSIVRRTWRLKSGAHFFFGRLTDNHDGSFRAAFDLGQLPRGVSTWEWAARLEDRLQRYEPSAAIVVNPQVAPVAAFAAAPDEGVAPLSVSFADLSTDWPRSWAWDFGDGGVSTEREPVHVYSSAGRFTVTLTVSNVAGSSQAQQLDLIDVRAPEPEFAIEYGMNSSENVWWQRGIAFADAMARASEFVRIANGQLTPERAPVIPLGEDPPRLGAGWPDSLALPANERPGARLFFGMNGSLPDGRSTPYVLTWAGTGSCSLFGAPVVSERNRGANRVEVLVDPSRGGGNGVVAWILDASSASDPVRDVHVWLPGMETEKPLFWPPFLEKLQAMNGGRGPHTWRTLDWSQIRHYGSTGSSLAFAFDLAGRITPSSPSQGTRRGVCPEFQVALCNAVGANLHFSLPHQAPPMSDADYELFVRDALLAIRDGSPAVPGVNGGRPFEGLAPGSTVTLAYSNEVWNPAFPVNAWMRARAAATGVSFHRQIALETERVFAIADQVFSGEHAPRLRKFVGGWLVDPSYLARVLAELSPGTRVDAVGPAAYFRPLSSTVAGWMQGATTAVCPGCPTPEEVVEASLLSIPVIAARLAEHSGIARSFHNADGSSPVLELYEAGAYFVAGYQPWAGAAAAAQSIPSMYDAYVQHLVPALVAEDVALVNWYSFVSSHGMQGASGSGPFGHWDNMDETITLPVPEPYVHEGAPKAAAIYRLPPVVE